MLPKMVASFGIGNNNNADDYKYHLFVIGKSGIKLFLYEDMVWGEDINKRVETSDFIFAYEQLGSILDDEEMRTHIEANLLF